MYVRRPKIICTFDAFTLDVIDFSAAFLFLDIVVRFFYEYVAQLFLPIVLQVIVVHWLGS